MNRFLLLFLPLISLFSCSPVSHFTRVEDMTQSFISSPIFLTESENKVLYKAQIDLYSKHFSGILVVKYVPADSVRRIVFLSEMGMSFFDFEFKNDSCKLVYAMKGFDRDIIIETLKKDLNQLMFNPAKGEDVELFKNNKVDSIMCLKTRYDDLNHYYLYNNQVLYNIESRGTIKKKKNIKISNISNNFPQEIFFKHKGIKLKIKLTKM